MVDIYIQSEVGVCQEFKAVRQGKKETISVVISPVKVISDPDNEKNIRVQNGCNMWRGCFNSSCFFSLAAREAPKVEKKRPGV